MRRSAGHNATFANLPSRTVLGAKPSSRCKIKYAIVRQAPKSPCLWFAKNPTWPEPPRRRTMRNKPNYDFDCYVDRAIFGQRTSMPSENRIDRRTFMKVSGGVLAVGITPAPKREASADSETPYPAKWYPFTGHPDSDTCWSLSVGPDCRIYAPACAGTVPGGVVKPVRYNEQRDELEYLFDLAEKVEDPGDSGRATQCKIHYSF